MKRKLNSRSFYESFYIRDKNGKEIHVDNLLGVGSENINNAKVNCFASEISYRQISKILIEDFSNQNDWQSVYSSTVIFIDIENYISGTGKPIKILGHCNTEYIKSLYNKVEKVPVLFHIVGYTAKRVKNDAGFYDYINKGLKTINGESVKVNFDKIIFA